MEINNVSFGKRIRHLRNALSLKQEELSILLGVSQNYISQIETGKRSPSEQLIKSLQYCFYLSEIWLKTGEGEMFISPKESLKRLIAQHGEQAILDAMNEIIQQKENISTENQHKCVLVSNVGTGKTTSFINYINTTLNDPELKRMFSYICVIWNTGDERLKSWASVQFDRAFPADVVEEAQKKQKETPGQISAG